MKNSQSIEIFFSKTHVNTRTGLARDVSLSNNTNEAVDVSDDLCREKEIQLPPKPPFSSPPKTQKQKSKSDDSFNDEFGETDQDRYFYDSEHPDNTLSFGMFEFIIRLLYYYLLDTSQLIIPLFYIFMQAIIMMGLMAGLDNVKTH